MTDVIRPAPAALVIAVIGAATILGAYFFQYVVGLPPCPLCLEQRIPYYVAIPLALIVAVMALRNAPPALVRGGLVLLTLAMLVSAGLGVYHAGIEWSWWTGPTECSGGPLNLNTITDITQQAKTAVVIRCDQAAWRFLGLSLAGYNALISLALAGVALAGAFAKKS